MDQDMLGLDILKRAQALMHRFLARSAAGHGLEHFGVSQMIGIAFPLAKIDHHLDMLNAVMVEKSLDRVVDQRLAGERQVLLGHRRTKSQSLARCNNHHANAHSGQTSTRKTDQQCGRLTVLTVD